MQPSLLETAPPADGATYDPRQDEPRLTCQRAQVKARLETGRRWTLAELQAEIGGSETGISARIRDLRKPKFGGYQVVSARRQGGTWEYWIADVENRQGRVQTADGPRRTSEYRVVAV